MSNELKPCPFCGGEAHIDSDYSSELDHTFWQVWHDCSTNPGPIRHTYGHALGMEISTPWCASEDAAVDLWNRRAGTTCELRCESRGGGRMISDTERREAARRLREIRPCKSGHIKWWEIARALGLKQPAGWFGWEKFEPDSANRLADLIEPDHVGDSTKMVDRDALLALADEIEDSDVTYLVSTQYVLDSYASRIREALGVER